jgi:hypothetical protein
LVQAILAIVAIAIVLANALQGAEAPGIESIGPPEVVFDWSKTACDPDDYPDLPARAFRDGEGRVQLIASHSTTRRMIGQDLNHLTHDCAVVMRSSNNPDPAKFDDKEWIGSTYTPDGRTVFALVHDEYQGQTHPGRCPSGQYFPCWYNAVTLAISSDGGRHYTQARPPGQLVASVPYRYVPETGPYGVFQPSNIVYNQDDRYYYTLVHVDKYGIQPAGTCLLRTRALADPRSWRAWGGHEFDISFVDPYLEPTSGLKAHICQPVAADRIANMSESLTYNTYFDKFILVGVASAYDRKTRSTVPGVYFSLSKDLLHWSERRLLRKAELPWTFKCGDRNPILYPSLLDPASQSRNFETTGKRAYIYFTRFNYGSCRMTQDRDLLRVPVEFRK